MKAIKVALLATTLLCAGVVSASARDQIRVVGSSTVYPFTTAVAENFGKKSGFKTPVVESTGTGGGMKLFCAGVGIEHPDATNASRRIKKGEFESCQKNGVTDIVELKVGYDGVSVAYSKKGKPINLTSTQVFLALAKEIPGPDGKPIPNPHKKWSDVDPSLPDQKIEVLGPPPTSGTRDSFHELVLEAGAKKIPALAELAKTDAKAFEKLWKTIREDGAYIDAGENDNLIVQKLEANPNAVGVFGYSFFEENQGALSAAKLDGFEPTDENIASGKYPASRDMFVYFKKAHIGVIKGLDQFITEYASDAASGEAGYLPKKGLIALPKAEHDAVKTAILSLSPLKADGLK